MSEEVPQVVPVLVDCKKYGSPGYVRLENIHLSDGSDEAYLYDPERFVPYQVNETGSWALSLNFVQARQLWDQLGTYLGE